MRALVCFSLLALPVTVAAEGLCEDSTNDAEVLAFSATTGQIAIQRTREICEEGPDATEQRHVFDFVEFVEASGKVIKTIDTNPDDHDAFKEHIAPAGSRHAELDKYLLEGLFKARAPAGKSANGICTAKLTRSPASAADGEREQFKLLLEVHTGAGKHATLALGEVEAYAPYSAKGRVWFFPEAKVVVAQWKAPSLQGPTAPDGSFKATLSEASAWALFDASQVDGLDGCFGAAPSGK